MNPRIGSACLDLYGNMRVVMLRRGGLCFKPLYTRPEIIFTLAPVSNTKFTGKLFTRVVTVGALEGIGNSTESTDSSLDVDRDRGE